MFTAMNVLFCTFCTAAKTLATPDDVARPSWIFWTASLFGLETRFIPSPGWAAVFAASYAGLSAIASPTWAGSPGKRLVREAADAARSSKVPGT